jgi:hypothetical protein
MMKITFWWNEIHLYGKAEPVQNGGMMNRIRSLKAPGNAPVSRKWTMSMRSARIDRKSEH